MNLKKLTISVALLSSAATAAMAESYQLTELRGDYQYRFPAGSAVYLLRTPEREAWVLETPSASAEGDLAGLGKKLYLPPGWRFEVQTLSQELVVNSQNAGGVLHTVTDDLGNLYVGCGLDSACNFTP